MIHEKEREDIGIKVKELLAGFLEKVVKYMEAELGGLWKSLICSGSKMIKLPPHRDVFGTKTLYIYMYIIVSL